MGGERGELYFKSVAEEEVAGFFGVGVFDAGAGGEFADLAQGAGKAGGVAGEVAAAIRLTVSEIC